MQNCCQLREQKHPSQICFIKMHLTINILKYNATVLVEKNIQLGLKTTNNI